MFISVEHDTDEDVGSVLQKAPTLEECKKLTLASFNEMLKDKDDPDAEEAFADWDELKEWMYQHDTTIVFVEVP